jgi:SAM-dependent methyltransferase
MSALPITSLNRPNDWRPVAAETNLEHAARPVIIRTCEPLPCCDEVWEAAYLRFETPREEINKFKTRLRKLGCRDWPRDAEIVEIFCGRGQALTALSELGFDRLEGCDLSQRLLEQCEFPARLYVADCRRLPFEDASRDIIIVQGGLHHLRDLRSDLPLVLAEVRRVLRPEGRFVVVEPWMTPFLACVHIAARQTLVRRLSRKLNALQTMTEREATTYFAWLAASREILQLLDTSFNTERRWTARGKVMFVGRLQVG